MKKRIPLFAALLFIFGCNNTLKPDSSYDYSIEQQRTCYCPLVGEWIRLFVVNDSVVKAIRSSDNYELTAEERTWYKSVQELFTMITETDTALYDVSFTVDPDDNYPSYVDFKRKPFVDENGNITGILMDADFSYKTRNFTTAD